MASSTLPRPEARVQPDPGRSGGTPAAVLMYLALSALLFAPLLSQPRSRIAADDAAEPGRSAAFNALWTSWWMQKQAAAWRDPYACDWVLPPEGARFGFDTHGLVPTLLTLPLVRLGGPVGAYNAAVLALVVAGAAALFALLRRGLGLPWGVAFLAGACFGFGATALATAHSQPWRLCGALWGGALAVLIHAYDRGRLGLRSGAIFALLVWACFWTSLPEFGVLVVVGLLAVAALELARLPGSGASGSDKARFALPLLAGAVSLLFLRHSPDSLPPAVRDPAAAALPLPVAALALAVIALVLHRREGATRRRLLALAAILVPLLALSLAPRSLALGLAAALPAELSPGGPASYLPAARFVLMILAAHGAAQLWSTRLAGARLAAIALGLVVVWESRPAPVHTSPVRTLESVIEGKRPNPEWRTLVVPRERYRDVDDTYQIAVDGPFVHNAFLLSRLPRAHDLAARYPRVYRDHSQTWDEQWGAELSALEVGYFLLADSTFLERLPPLVQRNVGMVGPQAVLVSLR